MSGDGMAPNGASDDDGDRPWGSESFDEGWLGRALLALKNSSPASAPAVPAPDHNVANDLPVSSGDQTFPAPVPTTTSAQIPATYQPAPATLTTVYDFNGGFNSQGYWNEQPVLSQGEQFDPCFIMANTTDSQEYAEAQGPTPPGDFNNQQPQQQNGGIAFNNPFPQSGQQQITQQAASQNQHPQQAEQPVRYSFNGGYQNGEQGYFQPQPAHRNSSNDSTPGTPGPNRVPIPRNSSASLSTPANSGPMSSTVTVPARPKPGRKPIVQDEANSADRRRMQNRNAQRNFRDRRQQKLSEMATEMDEARKDSLAKQAEWRAESENLHRQIRELKAQVAHLQHENGRMQEKLAQAETRRDTTAEVGMGGYPSLSQGPQTGHKRVRTDERTGPTSSSPPGAPAQVSPTTRTASPLEQDFTSRPAPRPMGQWRPSSTAPTAAPAPPAALAPAESVTESPAQIMGLEGKSYDCGFCTDASNCQCRYQDAITANALVDMSRVDRNGDETEAES